LPNLKEKLRMFLYTFFFSYVIKKDKCGVFPEAGRGSIGASPRILNLSTIWREVVRFILLLRGEIFR
jgi:hypothetical protein